MALDSLATSADLLIRKVDTSDPTLVDTMLAVASATVRQAAGHCPISQTTSTVNLTGWRIRKSLKLPGPPIQSVATVEIDGTAITDWRFTGDSLWRACGWGVDFGPAQVTITYTHGLSEVPANIVDLVAALASAGISVVLDDESDLAIDPRVIVEKIDDYHVEYAQGASAVATVMELPSHTKAWLRDMFGGSAGEVAV